MSATTFDFLDGTVTGVEDGSSILLTGADRDALESLFFAMMSPGPDEQPLVVTTEHRASEIGRHFDGDEVVITTEGHARGDNVTVVDDAADLTTLGMELSARFQEFADVPVRAGIFHTSQLCGEAGDTRSVYRFLNSNLMTHLRRQSGVGIGAIHTDSDIGTDVDSMIRGMETSFTGRVHIEDASYAEASVSVEGLGTDGEFDVSL
jgi:hypothetical protein